MYILMGSVLDIFLVRHTMYTLYWLRHNVPFARSSFSILSVSCYRLLVATTLYLYNKKLPKTSGVN